MAIQKPFKNMQQMSSSDKRMVRFLITVLIPSGHLDWPHLWATGDSFQLGLTSNGCFMESAACISGIFTAQEMYSLRVSDFEQNIEE
ncbi:hypothetical protein CEXT_360181 [Caerostris extrusa]|uniref:Uncharacterized protein n=1 Tax=Caerostris extrusa TaxID=172846 RepID=A0AAV4UK41_CAEEX|nr:hypothetical protein CEXT_360181 [Caerostris extrusa]